MTSKHGSSLGILVESFLTQRMSQQRQASPATLSAYKDALRLLFQFACAKLNKQIDRLDVQDLDYAMVLAFLDYLEQERGNSARTRNARLAVIHSFFQHIAYSELGALALAERILSIGPKRTAKRVVEYLHPPEVEALLAAPCRQNTLGRRDHVLLLFLLRTGARASEAVGINAADLALTPPCQVLIRGKGSKERVLPLVNDVATILSDLLEERQLGIHENTPVFVNAQGKRLTRFGLTHVVRRAVKKATAECTSLGKRPVSPHSFRHTMAMRLLQAGVDLTMIRAWLGHSDIQTTHGYLEADIEMKRHALAAANITPEESVRYEPPSALLDLLER